MVILGIIIAVVGIISFLGIFGGIIGAAVAIAGAVRMARHK